MSEDEPVTNSRTLGPLQRHRFMLLVGLTILVSLFLVSVALALYASSGAAQLDLSRPGYKSVRDQAVSSEDFNGFPATGSITKDTLDQFRKVYDDQAQQATNVDSFGGDIMSDQTLSIDAPASDTAK